MHLAYLWQAGHTLSGFIYSTLCALQLAGTDWSAVGIRRMAAYMLSCVVAISLLLYWFYWFISFTQ